MRGDPRPGDVERRLARERKARAEAEEIAERVTAQLYAANAEATKANEELQALNQALRDFISVASHDIRGPLSSILGFSRLLRSKWETIPPDDAIEYLEIMERQGGLLDRLVEDLLTVSRLEAGALDVHAEVVGLHDSVRLAIEAFAERAADIRLSLPVHLRVVADPDHLQRILANYVTNALKYGRPPVDVAAVDGDGWVEIRVCDAGDGVPDALVPRLFDRFSRAEGTAMRELPGIGLGLSIVKGLARANGGEAWYEAGKPHGACFVVRLPVPAA